MKKEGLTDFFENYLDRKPIFSNKSCLQGNYTPDNIPHRNDQIKKLAAILAPALRMEKPSNVFCYGKSGCISGDSLVYTDEGYVKIKNINEDSKVLSFNKKKKMYDWSHFIFLRYKNNDKLLKIILDNGISLVVTKDHPLLSFKLKWKKADVLQIGDEICLAYDIPNSTKNEIPLSMARLLGFVISDGSMNRKRIKRKDSRGYWYNSDKQRLRFYSEELDLIHMVRNDLKGLFKYSPFVTKEKNKCLSVQVVSQEVCQTLNNYGIPFGKKSSIVEVPEIIFKSNNVIQREFLKSLFSGDGTVNRFTYQVEYYSNSKKLLEGISYLLHQEGIACKIRLKIAKCNDKLFDSYRLYINGRDNLVRFYHKIGFYSQHKQNKLSNIVNKYKRRVKYNPWRYIFNKIENIEEVYESYVYDLKVPKNHNFIANGIISHNSGKSLCSQYVLNQVLDVATNKKLNLTGIYLNCKLKKISDTQYRLLAELLRNLGVKVPSTGLPTQDVYKMFIEKIDEKKQLLILVLDEIDQLVKKIGDEVLYNLTRLNSELKDCQICLIGISNDLMFTDSLDPRIKSSLSEEELVFPPYNAIQLQDILKERAKIAFQSNVVTPGVIEKCAAYAAREHGDARRALELLRVAGDLAERSDKTKIEIKNIDVAENKIEKDRVLDVIKTQPKQSQLALYSILKIMGNGQVFTGDVYEYYKDVCTKVGLKPLTQRRISDLVAELDMFGIINARVISKGRYGRTREITMGIPQSAIGKVDELLREGLGL